MFINQFSSIHENIPGINPMGLGATWANSYLETQQKEQSFVIFINQLLKIHQNLSIFRNFLESNQCIDSDR